MKRKIKRTFGLVAALSYICTPTLLMIVGIWMIDNVGLWVGLGLSAVGYAALVWEYGQIQIWAESRKSKKKTK
jgi:hypothetical protein|nr:MAG TPA: hypothetical protein [Caudoviricetes sp.]